MMVLNIPPQPVRWDRFISHDGQINPGDASGDLPPDVQLRKLAESLGRMNLRGAFENMASVDRKTIASLPLVLYGIAGEIAPPRSRLSWWARFRNAVMRRLP